MTELWFLCQQKVVYNLMDTLVLFSYTISKNQTSTLEVLSDPKSAQAVAKLLNRPL